MKKHLKAFTLKLRRYLLVLVVIFTVSTPVPQLMCYLAANVFFGQNKYLYNIKLAQVFYKCSTIPTLFGYVFPYSHYQLSRTYFVQGELDTALDEAKTELSLHPNNKHTYYILGLTLGYLGRYHEAIDAFSIYIDTHPGTWAGRNDKAWLQFHIGDIDGAINTIEPVAERFKNTPWIQNTYCTLLINKKRLEDAKKICSHANEIINAMTIDDWGRAYPGNNPKIWETGLRAAKKSITGNLLLLKQ